MSNKKIPLSFNIGEDRYSLAGLNGDYVKNNNPKNKIPANEIRAIYVNSKNRKL